MGEWIFLTSALGGGEWSASRSCRFTPGERASGTHWLGGWVGPRAGLDNVEKRKFLPLPRLELRPLCRPARIQSLYRLLYIYIHKVTMCLSHSYIPFSGRRNNWKYVLGRQLKYSRDGKKRECYPCNTPWRPIGLWDSEAPTFSRHRRR
jgi:hypothetical protein